MKRMNGGLLSHRGRAASSLPLLAFTSAIRRSRVLFSRPSFLPPSIGCTLAASATFPHLSARRGGGLLCSSPLGNAKWKYGRDPRYRTLPSARARGCIEKIWISFPISDIPWHFSIRAALNGTRRRAYSEMASDIHRCGHTYVHIRMHNTYKSCASV